MSRSPLDAIPAKNLPREERFKAGQSLRQHVPREAHAACPPASGRDPVAILAETDGARIPELLPIRYQRMLQSPFTFLRGAAAVMAHDLAATPQVGAHVQACGDCHLLNFGVFSTPEGRVLFDINDFDETLPGIDFTVDIKRLAASVAVAALDAKMPDKRARALATGDRPILPSVHPANLPPSRHSKFGTRGWKSTREVKRICDDETP